MADSTSWFIAACWAAWLAYWLIMAFRTKPTIERGGLLGYRLVTIAVFGVAVAALRLLHASQTELWQRTLAVGALSDVMVLAGAAFTVWARVALGGNWSAEVTFKEDHELIEAGPYALVRHPIYTGLITMAIGTAISYGRPTGFALLIGLCGGVWWKARDEERIMSSHFPRDYPDYRRRVRAIIPFVL